ncbi:UBC-like protein [Macrolepiota fuliginosa MF-IS2]|uniref:Ubiquitin-conjugating enzyme E2 6 n=1 Tax=Macrolepiota fuliginosa MF-IS2 TaxID=1400762 RepID=A0A9P5XI67_9AGAR|nr:UBC-like protein [Macrolepiota fuliginosa MF-IS2]
MASKAAHKRLNKEYVAMQKEPPPFVWAVPDEKNILTWDYIIRGPPDSPYAGGEYHGQLVFPSEYPFKPPGIKMITPSGRFQPDKKICFSMSDFHPGTWNPAWSVATILTGLLSFMLSDEMTTGSLNSSEDVRRAYAARSHEWNLAQPRFREVFPEYCTPSPCDLPNMAQKERGKTPPAASPSSQATSSSPAVRETNPANPVAPQSEAGPGTPTALPSNPKSTTARTTGSSAGPGSGNKQEEARTAAAGWAASWSQLLWEKWRWGALIALAVLVSRFSSSV